MKPLSNQAGLALPTVMALAMICSVLLLSEWRSLGLAEGFGRISQQRWHLQNASHAALLAAVADIQGPPSDERHQPGSAKSIHAFFPKDLSTWKILQTRLGSQDCLTGICKPLGPESNNIGPWQTRLLQAQAWHSDEYMTVAYWIEVMPLVPAMATPDAPFVYRITSLAKTNTNHVVAHQALWHPSVSHPASTGIPMNLAGFKRLLKLSP